MANEMRLIDANAMRKKWTSERDFMLNRWGGYGALLNREKGRVDELEACIADVESAPTVDAKPVVHGRWHKPTPCSGEFCTNCLLTPKTNFGWLPPYCPNCGAQMDLK